MISKEKLQLLAQMIQSMHEAAYELDKAVKDNDIEKKRRVKEFIINLQTKISAITKEK